MRSASRFAGLVTMATIAVSGMAVSGASACSPGSLEPPSDTWADCVGERRRLADRLHVVGRWPRPYVRDVATGEHVWSPLPTVPDEGERLREHPGSKVFFFFFLYVPEKCAQPRPAGHGHPLRHLPQGGLSTGALTVVSTTSAARKGNCRAARSGAGCPTPARWCSARRPSTSHRRLPYPSDCYPGEKLLLGRGESTRRAFPGRCRSCRWGPELTGSRHRRRASFADISADGDQDSD